MSRPVVIDDHLLVRFLRGRPPKELSRTASIATTGLWYHRLGRALVTSNVAGLLSRAMGRDDSPLGASLLHGAITLPASIGLISLRELAWPMAELLASDVRLNLIGLEALAAAEHLEADLVLARPNADGPLVSAATARGVHVRVLG